jgi:uncharacterized membrane protein YgdD (TMEM256/DUF423 family)
MRLSWLTVVGALFGMAAVLLGAFGAHGLGGRVSAERLEVWSTAAHYLGWHATTLLALGLAARQFDAQRRTRLLASAAGWCLGIGTLVFSGSLFTLVLTDQSAWGAVTPVGGLLLAFGWALIALSLVLAETAHSKRA